MEKQNTNFDGFPSDHNEKSDHDEKIEGLFLLAAGQQGLADDIKKYKETLDLVSGELCQYIRAVAHYSSACALDDVDTLLTIRKSFLTKRTKIKKITSKIDAYYRKTSRLLTEVKRIRSQRRKLTRLAYRCLLVNDIDDNQS